LKRANFYELYPFACFILSEFQAAFKPGSSAAWTQLEYTVPELVRSGDCVQIDHPAGHRLLAALPTKAQPGTKIFLSVPAASSAFPPLTAVKYEAIVGGTVGGIKASSSTALKVVTWKDDARTCEHCQATFGNLRFRRHHHCRACGASVCSACSPAVKSVPGYKTDQRVCCKCVEGEVTEAAAPTAAPVGAAAPLI
jgi:hypothetical protein